MVKNPPANTGDTGDAGLISGSGRSRKIPGGGNGIPLQYSCLKNPMDRGAWRATIHGVAESRTQLSDFTFFFFYDYTVEVRNRFKGLDLIDRLPEDIWDGGS